MNSNQNNQGKLRCHRCGQKDYFKRDYLTKNVNINMLEVEKNKPITSKMILKKSKIEDKVEVETEISKVKVNLRQKSSIYRYDIIDDFR